MKTTSIALIAAGLLASTAALAGNYLLSIDGTQYELDLGTPTAIPLGDGRKVSVMLEKKDIASFRTTTFSFDYPSNLTPARSDLGAGVHQTAMMTPLGTLVLVQEYARLNPCGLVDFMLRELTKEEIQYGYEITEAAVTRSLADGLTLTGKHSISRYRDDEYERYVMCYGLRDAGILVITQVERIAPPEDRAIFDLFWETMDIHME